MSPSLAVLLAATGLAVLAAGCESTQDRSARLKAEGAQALIGEKGLRIGARARDVRVGTTAVLEDSNGAAVVAELTNTSAKPLRDVPIAVDVTGKGGKSVYKNDDPGLDRSLTSISLLPPRASILWVNDQAALTGPGKRVAIEVGAPRKQDDGTAPKLAVSAPRITQDPVSGVEALASVTNDSKVEQRDLVILGVARRGGRVVAAGRAIVPRVRPGKKAKFSLFFIGNPKGAKVTLSAPPTTFQ